MKWWVIALGAFVLWATQSHAYIDSSDCQELLKSFPFPGTFQSPDGIGRIPHFYTKNRQFYTKHRGQSYEEFLGGSFIAFIRSLPASAIRIESGPGDMSAAHDFALHTPSGPNLIVIAPELSHDLSNFEALKRILGPNRFYPILGGGTEDVEAIPASSVDVFDDCMAAVSYSSPDVVLRKALHWLKVGGKAFLALSTRNYLVNRATQTRARFLGFGPTQTETVFLDRSFREFFEKISGVEVAIREYEMRTNDWIFQIEITKRSETVTVPELELVSSTEDYPPERRFLLK